MAKNKIYHIIRVATKTSAASGDYDQCLRIFNSKDKTFRKTHKIIPEEDYNKIIKKQTL